MSALHQVLLAALRWQPEGVEEVHSGESGQSPVWMSHSGRCGLRPGCSYRRRNTLPQIVVEFIEDGEEARARQIVRFLAPDDMPRIAHAVGHSGTEGH